MQNRRQLDKSNVQLTPANKKKRKKARNEFLNPKLRVSVKLKY